MIVTRSTHDYAATHAALLHAIEQRGLTVFTRVNHAAAARDAGLDMADEEVVLFGNPRAGTPLMQADPRVGIELPLRILVWADDQGALVGFRDPRELREAYDLESEAAKLDAMADLLGAIAGEAVA